MATNPLKTAQNEAAKQTAELGRLFDAVGVDATSNPNGSIQVIYRNAQRALKGSDDKQAVREVLATLREQVLDISRKSLLKSATIGINGAKAQLLGYGAKVDAPPGLALGQETNEAAQAMDSAITAQVDQAFANYVITGEIVGLIGDEGRQGIISSNQTLLSLATWLSMLSGSMFNKTVGYSGEKWQKQVIATISQRTTQTCLRAHGQIQPLDGKFRLTGTPRYADYLDWTPFHYYCRSSVALYLPEYDFGLTDAMTEAAARELAVHEKNKTTAGQYHNALGE